MKQVFIKMQVDDFFVFVTNSQNIISVPIKSKNHESKSRKQLGVLEGCCEPP